MTGDGRLVTCSPDRESELFNMVLGGLGQCGIIVRARVPLVPAPSHVTLHDLIYTDLDKYLTDQLQLAKDGRFDSQRGGMSRKKNGEWSFAIEVGKFFSPPDEPDFASLESGLQFDFATAPLRMTYRDYLFRFEAGNAAALSNKAPRVFITMPSALACRQPSEHSSIHASYVQSSRRRPGVFCLAVPKPACGRSGSPLGDDGKQPRATCQNDCGGRKTLQPLLGSDVVGRMGGSLWARAVATAFGSEEEIRPE